MPTREQFMAEALEIVNREMKEKERLDKVLAYKDAVRGYEPIALLACLRDSLHSEHGTDAVDVIYRPALDAVEFALCRGIKGTWENFTQWYPLTQAGLKDFFSECYRLHDSRMHGIISVAEMDRDAVISRIDAVNAEIRRLKHSRRGKENVENARANGKTIGRPRKRQNEKANSL